MNPTIPKLPDELIPASRLAVANDNLWDYIADYFAREREGADSLVKPLDRTPRTHDY